MSAKEKPTFAIVVDASVARAAGEIGADSRRGSACTQFLESLRKENHRLALGPTLDAEWDKHVSGFAFGWFTSMSRRGKVVTVDDAVPALLAEGIESASADPGVVAAMAKDAHLITAAVNSDARVASLDDRVRGHFSKSLRAFDAVMEIAWVNPVEEADAGDWLRAGAPAHHGRKLRNYSAA